MSGLTFVPCNTLNIIAQLRRTIHIFDCSCLNFLSIVFQQEDDLEKQNEELRQKKHHTEADSTEVLLHRSKSNFAPNDRLGIFFSRLYPVWLGLHLTMTEADVLGAENGIFREQIQQLQKEKDSFWRLILQVQEEKESSRKQIQDLMKQIQDLMKQSQDLMKNLNEKDLFIDRMATEHRNDRLGINTRLDSLIEFMDSGSFISEVVTVAISYDSYLAKNSMYDVN
ncbi:hypothetical protein ABG067_005035 [Albugo candida]